MALDHKPFASLTGEDILSLRENDVRESARLEYKLTLPGQQSESKKEFLADVSSFANARGGFILFGVEEVEGAAVAFPGVGADQLDTEILRLESIVRDGLEPRLPSIEFRSIPMKEGAVLMVGAIPSSIRGPHMVKYGGSSRFYGRHSGGKYQMDVGEIRSAFLRSEVLAERVRRFRRERLDLWGDSRPISPPPTVVIQLIPESFVEAEHNIDLSAADETRLRAWASKWLVPGRFRRNIDGVIVLTAFKERNAAIQLLRNGTVEAVGEHIFVKVKGQQETESKEDLWVWMDDLESLIKGTVEESLKLQRELGISPPVWLAVSMIGVHGVFVAGDSAKSGWLDRQRLLFPEVMIEAETRPLDEQLRPLMERLWQAADLERPAPELERAN